MTQAIITGISNALFEEFGEGYAIFAEEARQGLKEPCFFILPVFQSSGLHMGQRYLRKNRFCIQFFPKSDISAREECLSTAERMNWCMELIRVSGKRIRGTDMTYEVNDGVLSFFVNYDCFLSKREDSEKMGSMSPKTDVKG